MQGYLGKIILEYERAQGYGDEGRIASAQKGIISQLENAAFADKLTLYSLSCKYDDFALLFEVKATLVNHDANYGEARSLYRFSMGISDEYLITWARYNLFNMGLNHEELTDFFILGGSYKDSFVISEVTDILIAEAASGSHDDRMQKMRDSYLLAVTTKDAGLRCKAESAWLDELESLDDFLIACQSASWQKDAEFRKAITGRAEKKLAPGDKLSFFESVRRIK